MNVLDTWFPRSCHLGGMVLDRVVFGGEHWQIYDVKGGGRVLFARHNLLQYWLEAQIIGVEVWHKIKYGNVEYAYVTSPRGLVLAPMQEVPCRIEGTYDGVLSFAMALAATRAVVPQAALENGVFVERYSRILPVSEQSVSEDDAVILGRVITRGACIPATRIRRILQLAPTLSKEQLKRILNVVDLTAVHSTSNQSMDDANLKRFILPGRRELESFLREHIVDIIENEEDYAALGISFPGAFILQGPPGCGKTYAIEKLVEYLGWPMYEVNSSSIGSPYIHETGKKIGQVFEKAMQNSPAVVVIDEMEAFLRNRTSEGDSSGHHVEEVAEFLRMLPKARENRVLVIAMTNMIDTIDPAILRRGRFDHVIDVGLPTAEEIEQVLRNAIEKLPHEDVPYSVLAGQLRGLPMSDVVFVLREAARLSARRKLGTLTYQVLLEATERQSAARQCTVSHTIGFHP